MMNYEVQVPISRFRRELNRWMRFTDKYPEKTIFLTRNNVVVIAVVSPSKYEALNSELIEK